IMEYFYNSDKSIAILTGDSKENAENVAVQCELVNNYKRNKKYKVVTPAHIPTPDKPFDLGKVDPAELKSLVRGILSDIKRKINKATAEANQTSMTSHTSNGSGSSILTKSSDQVLILRGESFETMLSDSYLNCHLAFIILYCKIVVGWAFSPSQKG